MTKERVTGPEPDISVVHEKRSPSEWAGIVGRVAFFSISAIYMWSQFPIPEIRIIYELY